MVQKWQICFYPTLLLFSVKHNGPYYVFLHMSFTEKRHCLALSDFFVQWDIYISQILFLLW